MTGEKSIHSFCVWFGFFGKSCITTFLIGLPGPFQKTSNNYYLFIQISQDICIIFTKKIGGQIEMDIYMKSTLRTFHLIKLIPSTTTKSFTMACWQESEKSFT